MSLRAQLQAQLARFDDEAFAALANRGLLRRALKDLETTAVAIAEESPTQITLVVAEHRIVLDSRGPAQAKCSCPASGICQHILAAAIALQRMGADGRTDADFDADSDAAAAPMPGGANVVPEDGLEHLQQELLNLTPAQLTKHAGRPGYRWAWQFLQDLPEAGLRISGNGHLVLAFDQPPVRFHYMGGDVANLIADTALPQLAKYQVAAVLALRRALGHEVSPPEATAREVARSLDLGKDHAVADARGQANEESRARLRAAASQLFRECVELGLSHLSVSVQERLATLAVWAQGAEYYRLALSLRRLADHVELLLERAGGADEHRLFEELAVTNALVEALAAAALGGAAPARLVGRARTKYSETGSLELIGLGATPWRSASGYVGLTMLFWSPTTNGFMTCTDARPQSQRGFNPVTRYKAAGPWMGLGAPAQATGSRVTLTGAQLNGAGRISASDQTAATVEPLRGGAELVSALPVARSWSQIALERSALRRSLLAEPQPTKDWQILAPATFGKAAFDANRQTIVWPMLDAHGDRLDAEIAFGDYAQHAIGRIEQLQANDLPDGTLLVGRMRHGGSNPVVEPLSLIRPRPGVSPVDALYFDPAPKRDFMSSILGARLIRGKDDAGQAHAAPLAELAPPALREYGHWLARESERGCSSERTSRVLQASAAAATRLRDRGFGAFAAVAQSTQDAATLLLRQQYTLMQYMRLLDVDVPQESSD